MINFRSCEAINHNFIVTDEGEIACPATESVIKNSLQRAYIFTNLFFYDITMREVGKLEKKIAAKREEIIASSGIPAEDVERLYPSLTAYFKQEVGDDSLEPLIKTELAKTNKHLSLQLSNAEQKSLEEMRRAICDTEIAKFKKATLFDGENQGKPYQVTFSEKYINNLPPRCKRFLKPTIKMLAYMDGKIFDQFELTADYKLTYTWSMEYAVFSEDTLKQEIKTIIAQKEENDV